MCAAGRSLLTAANTVQSSLWQMITTPHVTDQFVLSSRNNVTHLSQDDEKCSQPFVFGVSRVLLRKGFLLSAKFKTFSPRWCFFPTIPQVNWPLSVVFRGSCRIYVPLCLLNPPHPIIGSSSGRGSANLAPTVRCETLRSPVSRPTWI